MMKMSCDCGFNWDSNSPSDSVEYHMVYHKNEYRLASIDKGYGTWHLNLAKVAYPKRFVRDD